MKTGLKKFIFWAPRAVSILFLLFISMFALDVFSEGYSLGETIPALIMHLIPTMIIVILLIIAWRRELIGAILFISIALLYLLTSRGESWIISGPLLALGILFLLSSYTKQT